LPFLSMMSFKSLRKTIFLGIDAYPECFLPPPRRKRPQEVRQFKPRRAEAFETPLPDDHATPPPRPPPGRDLPLSSVIVSGAPSDAGIISLSRLLKQFRHLRRSCSSFESRAAVGKWLGTARTFARTLPFLPAFVGPKIKGRPWAAKVNTSESSSLSPPSSLKVGKLLKTVVARRTTFLKVFTYSFSRTLPRPVDMCTRRFPHPLSPSLHPCNALLNPFIR